MQICQAWRDIALSTPQLWCSLDFAPTIDLHSYSEYPATITGIKKWFSRAGNQDLKLMVSFPSGGFHRSQLLYNISWWRVTDLELKDELLTPIVIHEIFSQCPNLIICDLSGVGSEDHLTNPFEGYPILELPKLTSLVIYFSHLQMGQPTLISYRTRTKISPLLEVLRLPALQVLELRTSTAGSDDYALPHVLLAHQHASRPPLQRLVLGRILFNPASLRRFLAYVPSLTYLHLAAADHGCHFFPELVKQFAYETSSQNNVLPRLKVLAIEDNISYLAEENLASLEASLLDAVSSRRWPRRLYPYKQQGMAQLEELTILWDYSNTRPTNPSACYRVEELEKTGLYVRYPTSQEAPPTRAASLGASGGMNPHRWGRIPGADVPWTVFEDL